MTTVVFYLGAELARRDRQRRIAEAAAVEPAYVTRRCGHLFAPTPWRDYTSQPPSDRLLALRGRKARRRIKADRESRQRADREFPLLRELELAIARLKRYEGQLKRESS